MADDGPILVLRRSPSVLSDHPEVAIKVANFIADFSFLEFTLYAALATILKDDGPFTHIILSRFNSFSNKLDVVLDIARTRQADLALAKLVVAAEPDIRLVNTFRNRLAHGMYVEVQGETTIAVLTNMFVADRADPHAWRLTDERFAEHQAAMERVDTSIHESELLLDQFRVPMKKGRR